MWNKENYGLFLRACCVFVWTERNIHLTVDHEFKAVFIKMQSLVCLFTQQ